MQEPYLKVSELSRLLCVLSWSSSTRNSCSNTMVRWAPKSECVAICGETNNELLSWGSLALPVVHGIILEQRRRYTCLWNYKAFV